MYALTWTLLRRSRSIGGAALRGSRQSASLHLTGLLARWLALMSDSLVRVTIQAEWGAHWPMPRAHTLNPPPLGYKLMWPSSTVVMIGLIAYKCISSCSFFRCGIATSLSPLHLVLWSLAISILAIDFWHHSGKKKEHNLTCFIPILFIASLFFTGIFIGYVEE